MSAKGLVGAVRPGSVDVRIGFLVREGAEVNWNFGIIRFVYGRGVSGEGYGSWEGGTYVEWLCADQVRGSLSPEEITPR